MSAYGVLPSSRRRGALSLVAIACLQLVLCAQAAEAAAQEAVYAHRIATGETLIGVAQRYLAEPGRWRELSRINGLRDPDRIATGALLQIPLRLMRDVPAQATVLSVTGEARAGDGPVGTALNEGDDVRTGPDGHVSLRLVDGTVLRLRPGSRLQLTESRRVPQTDAARSGARLEQGRVEVEAEHAPAGRPGFKIDTPQGVLGVRGTEFRVATDGAQGVTHGEVLSGVVAFDGSAGSRGERVGANFGAVISANGRVDAPVALLAAPDVAGLPALEERILMRIPLPPIAGAVAYRGQIARDAAFDNVVADLTAAEPELRFAELPDGNYLLRVRGIGAEGLEGQDATHPFRLKARPEAPLPSLPAPRARLYGTQADFAWATNPEARSYRLQVANDEAFTDSLRDIADLQKPGASVTGLSPGLHYWRVASVRDEADRGPWGHTRSFEMRPDQQPPAPPVVDQLFTQFSWDGEAGQSFDFEVARDAAFTAPVIERRLAEPRIALTMPGPGRFYFRLRARDADGFVGPYTTPQFFDVSNCLRDGAGQCVRGAERTVDLTP